MASHTSILKFRESIPLGGVHAAGFDLGADFDSEI